MLLQFWTGDQLIIVAALQIVEKSFVSETATIAMIYAHPSQQPHIISLSKSSIPRLRHRHQIFMIQACTTTRIPSRWPSEGEHLTWGGGLGYYPSQPTEQLSSLLRCCSTHLEMPQTYKDTRTLSLPGQGYLTRWKSQTVNDKRGLFWVTTCCWFGHFLNCILMKILYIVNKKNLIDASSSCNFGHRKIKTSGGSSIVVCPYLTNSHHMLLEGLIKLSVVIDVSDAGENHMESALQNKCTNI